MLQFGHGGEAVENLSRDDVSWPLEQCFNSATALKPWRTSRSWRPERTRHQLQFGHGLKPWRTRGEFENLCDEAVASIRPRLEAVENAACRRRPSSTTRRFNSATAVKPWRTPPKCGQSDETPYQLQFGHGGEAVENVRLTVLGAAGLQLQFGHGGEAVENAVNDPGIALKNQLQFGHGLKPWRT